MEEKKMHYLGIVVSGSSHPYTCVSMDDGLHIEMIKKLNIEQLTEIIDVKNAVIAINAPSNVHQDMMMDPDVRSRLSAPPKNGRYTNLRVADYELLQMGVKIPRVPHEIDRCPVWMQKGFLLFDRLGSMGYRMSGEDRRLIEINAEAVFLSILGFKLYDAKSLEGRIQRQLLLFEKGLDINDPMEFFQEITRHRLLQGSVPFSLVYPAVELAALVTAYMAWYGTKYPQRIYTLGHEIEGLVHLPKQANVN